MNPAAESTSMLRFDSDGVELAYIDRGSGPPVLLIHGFGANAIHNWVELGWVDRLTAAGHRVVAFDHRGHGESRKLYTPDVYSLACLREDARRLLDHLEIESADVLGYSMGARVAALLCVNHPSRARSLVLSGMGRNLFAGLPPALDIAEDLEAESLEDAKSDKGRLFRAFVDRTRGDRRALAACMRATREPVDPDALRRLGIPILVVIGTRDALAGAVEDMAPLLPDAELFDIPGRSHMGAIADSAFIERVLEFLASRP